MDILIVADQKRDKPLIELTMPSGEVTEFTQEEYNEFIKGIVTGLSDWLSEEKSMRTKEEYDKLVLKFLQWVNKRY